MTSNAAHTPGRMHVGNIKTVIYDEHNTFRAHIVDSGGAAEKEANARRLVACWNAAHDAGLSTEALEARVVKKMAQAIFEIALVYPDRLSLEEAREAISSIGNLARAVLAKLADSPKQSQEGQ